MSLETKDWITFAFSAAALALSVYNFMRARLDAKALDQRNFEQKRFEAVAVAEEIQSLFAQIEDELESLRFEGLLADNPTVVEVAERRIRGANAIRSKFESRSEQLRAVSGPRNSPRDLLEIEKALAGC